jgi:hypothetical protein
VNGALLDVNVLLALAWPNHQFHGKARQWFGRRRERWFTCALTQIGFVRLSSNPAFTEHAKRPIEAAGLLSAMTRHPEHRFISELDPLDAAGFIEVVSRLMGHKQLTDAYLLALAHKHDLQLVTFDRRIEMIDPYDGVVVRLEA